TCVSGWYP
ncbi:aldehyde dehydrogenase family protein, partial [Vibrio parahaemolyticus EKP-028]